MCSFDQLKAKHGTTPKEPLLLPHVRAYCTNCETETGTRVYFMRQGLGSGCDRCGQFRKGKRFLSKVEFAEFTKPARASAEVKHAEKERV